MTCWTSLVMFIVVAEIEVIVAPLRDGGGSLAVGGGGGELIPRLCL